MLYLLAALGDDYLLLMQRVNAGLLCMTVIARLVVRRVIPFFAMRAVPGLTLPMQERSGEVQLGAPGRWRWSSCCGNCACPLH